MLADSTAPTSVYMTVANLILMKIELASFKAIVWLTQTFKGVNLRKQK
jgi:hypothetical protein